MSSTDDANERSTFYDESLLFGVPLLIFVLLLLLRIPKQLLGAKTQPFGADLHLDRLHLARRTSVISGECI